MSAASVVSIPSPSTAPAVREIPLDCIRESKANPRRSFDEAKLRELADKSRLMASLQPVLVRPLADDPAEAFELVAGARRFRAAKLAGRTTIPATVRDLTDTECLELQLVENLQRSDVHELDEARGYAELIRLNPTLYTVEALAVRVGRSPAYVAGRIRLNSLVPAVQSAFYEGRLTVAHALEIARLQSADQERALTECFPGHRSTTAILKDRKAEPVTVRELRKWIEREIHLDLTKAPFDPADVRLVAQAGPCTACPKRTGNNPLLFPEIRNKSTCTDSACYKAKINALVEISTAALVERDEKPVKVSEAWRYSYGQRSAQDVLYAGDYRTVNKDECPSTTAAVIIDGRNAGKTLYVCAESKCKVHSQTSAYALSPEKREQRRQMALALRIQQESRRRILDTIRERLPGKLTRGDLEMLALTCFGWLGYDHQRQMFDVYGWEKTKTKTAHGTTSVDYRKLGEAQIKAMSPADLNRFLIVAVLLSDLYCPSWQPDGSPSKESRLAQTAARYRVDVAKITAQVKAELSNKKRKKPTTGEATRITKENR